MVKAGGRRVVGGLLFGTALLLGTVPAAADAAIVRLEATGPTQVPQGAPMRYRAVVSNPAATAQDVSLTLTLAPLGEPAAAVREWSGTVPAGGTVTVNQEVVSSQWFAEIGAFELADTSGAARLPFVVTAPTVTVARFEDVTAAAGLETLHSVDRLCDNFSAGAAWGDVDGDGDLDLYLPHQTAPAQLWINDGGLFVDRAREAGVDNGGALGAAAGMADYDNDGDLDIYVSNDGPNRLYRNDGHGRFKDVAPQAGVADPGPGTGAAWGDYDGDGLLDVYVVNYGRCLIDVELGDDVLYHNEGDGTFTDRSALLESNTSTLGLGFQASWLDYDGDGDVDLHLANDNPAGFPYPNALWRNDGPGPGGTWRFTDVSASSGARISVNSMGTAVGDYDRDGDLDLAISNMGPTVLLQNQGDGTFIDRAAAAGVARPDQRAGAMSVTWGMEMRDLNNDGWEDLYAAAGDMAPPPEVPMAQPNGVFLNAGDGTFFDLSAPSGADDPEQSRGIAVADYDRDGRLDLYVVNQAGHPRLYHNVTTGQEHWLEVHLVGTVSNRDACGARVVAEVRPPVRHVRQVLCGSTSLGSGSDPTVHFGLGRSARVHSLTVEWPSGATQVVRNQTADRLITLHEPLAPANARPIAGDDTLTTQEDVAATLDVLANDTDPDGGALSVSMADPTSERGGTVACSRAGSCSYTPPANAAGADSFEYTVADGAGGVDTGIVSITIDPVADPPIARDDAAATQEEVSVEIDVLANDTDPDGDALAITAFDATSAHGGAVQCTSSRCTYAPAANFAGTDSFGYTAAAPDGATGSAVVRITVADANDPPAAGDDAATTPQYTPVEIDVLANDADPDGDPLTVVEVGMPEHGTATVDRDGIITYAPDATFKGSDTFSYTITDRRGGVAAATVTILEDGCGEDGPVSRMIDREVEPLLAQIDLQLARMLHDVNCALVVPAEDALP